VSGGIGNICECTSKCKVEKYSNSGEEDLAGQKADEEDGDDGVKHTSSGNALYGSDIGVDVQAMVVQDNEEVGKDTKNNCRATELDEPNEHRD